MSGFERRSRGDGGTAKTTGDPFGSPGKRTLVEAIEPVTAAV